MMNDAVFISDLHLHPDSPDIHARFLRFLDWAKNHTKSLYILGDFFHVWVGDDCLDTYTKTIVEHLNNLHQEGVRLFFLPGNRDFLIGDDFLQEAKLKRLHDPCVIKLSGERLFLTHGDAYCSRDYGHMLLRKLTRPKLFQILFNQLPKSFRYFCVHQLRTYSKGVNRKQKDNIYQVVDDHLCKDMLAYHVHTAIYGHVHLPQKKEHTFKKQLYTHYVLSDWDAEASILCYNKVDGVYFKKIN